jgi:SAM-dependent methyltransferase
MMYSPADQSIEEFYKHQEVLLPHTSPYLGKTNVDIGCGTGLTSIIHQQQIGISPTICDVADFRHPSAQSLPFHLIHDEKLPFDDKSFESSYIRYVLHHLQTSSDILQLLSEALRVSPRLIIVEEIKGDRTDVLRARQFDQEVNEKIHPNISMPVFGYSPAKGRIGFALQLDGRVLFHRRISEGEEDNGFLETHIFVITRQSPLSV